MNDFAPLPALLGGALIGLAATIVLLFHGRIAGVSGMVGGLLARDDAARPLRTWFLAGLVLAGVALAAWAPSTLSSVPTIPLWAVALAGVLVGLGTRLGNGCTSGHGVCGIGRFSKRSLVATMTFMACAMVTVFILRRAGVALPNASPAPAIETAPGAHQ